MSTEPDSLILQLLRQMRAELGTVRAEVETIRAEMKDEFAEVRSEMHSLRADVASDLLVARKETSEQIVGLRRAVIEYHSSVIGHGVLISELEARVRRVEQHLNLPSSDPH
ncbi:hypothetical protein ACSBOB_01150 [Mesorhizobium sp. ASY16-5R]|uniref:hypothetical protein n=1 Tax=Mesorhizobium sp. ASY16-5R TaxID=3445772 RepID=UPI003F9F07DD